MGAVPRGKHGQQHQLTFRLDTQNARESHTSGVDEAPENITFGANVAIHAYNLATPKTRWPGAKRLKAGGLGAEKTHTFGRCYHLFPPCYFFY